MMTNEDIQRALDRLRKNATYHGDEAEDWTVDGDAETIRQCLTQALEPDYKSKYEELEKYKTSSEHFEKSYDIQQKATIKAKKERNNYRDMCEEMEVALYRIANHYDQSPPEEWKDLALEMAEVANKVLTEYNAIRRNDE